ncbi:alanine--tRNA ligase-related protein [Nakamurella endophytica]|nr:alanine--tRNA ligase-related protein [Nakamurella endophytica]
MDVDAIRTAYLEFMADRGHVVLPRAPLVPHDDPTTLFTGSGMQPLLPYLLGAPHPACRRLTDSQTCLRAQDIEDVGDNRHTTFFEMLGNWSLGDYFKDVQLPQCWEFLTAVLGLDPARIYVTCFSGDDEHGIPRDLEAADIWTGLFRAAGVSADRAEVDSEEHASEVGTGGARIVFYGKKNWWCRGGSARSMPVGEPGGPDSEMFYLYPQVPHDPAYGRYCHQNCDCGRFVELGNSVFLQYRRTATGFEELPQRNVDFGAGLARLSAATMDSPDIFRISSLWPVVERLQELSGRSYDDDTEAMRVIADHLRGATFLAVDGVRPGNKAQGYVLRRLVRRAMRFAVDLGLSEDFVAEIVPTIAGIYEHHYPEVAESAGEVAQVLAREERAFRRSLRKGIRQLEGYRRTGITGKELFTLYDTFGFPVELSTEQARRSGIAVSDLWSTEFDTEMAAQRARSRRSTSLGV